MIINGINTKGISVIVQGAIDRENTPRCINSLRKYLPGSEIILSTWEGSNTSGLNCDEVICSSDPGGFRDKFCTSFTNNTLRQLVSTQAGVRRASRNYILKVRSDLILKSSKFLGHFYNYPKRCKNLKVFENRIIFSSFFTKQFCSTPTVNQPLPFHVSDWFVFGTNNDIQYLYDIPLPVEPLNSWYLADTEFRTVKPNLLGCSHRYAPEQYIFFSACNKKFHEIIFDHYMDYTKENILLSEMLIANNCIILDPPQCKFVCGKREAGDDRYYKWTKHMWTMPKTLTKGLYLHDKFVEIYDKHCSERGQINDVSKN